MIVRNRAGEWGWRGKKSRASFSNTDDVVAFSVTGLCVSLPGQRVQGHCCSRCHDPGPLRGSSHRSSTSPQVQFWPDGVRSCPTAVFASSCSLPPQLCFCSSSRQTTSRTRIHNCKMCGYDIIVFYEMLIKFVNGLWNLLLPTEEVSYKWNYIIILHSYSNAASCTSFT